MIRFTCANFPINILVYPNDCVSIEIFVLWYPPPPPFRMLLSLQKVYWRKDGHTLGGQQLMIIKISWEKYFPFSFIDIRWHIGKSFYLLCVEAYSFCCWWYLMSDFNVCLCCLLGVTDSTKGSCYWPTIAYLVKKCT